MAKRTDLALEARELWQEAAGQTTRLPGVRARESSRRGIHTTVVEILDGQGVRALGKPRGTYITLEWEGQVLRDRAGFGRAAVGLGKALTSLIPQDGPVLVAGLGNPAVTPDAIGPKTLEHLLVTRHLHRSFPQFRPVSAISPGVLGVTGLESVEVVRGIVERSGPACVVVVDALASREPARICTTVQLTDTGIIPGSGIRNSRAAFDRETLGVPVVSVGVPTVVDAATFAEDIGGNSERTRKNQKNPAVKSMVVIPRDMDTQVDRMARFLGCGISLGLHGHLGLGDLVCLMG